MCTLSFSPTRDGLLLAMNRDESVAREIARSPEIVSLKSTLAVYPREANGGTWIGANNRGLLLALLNKNGDPNDVKQRSRGSLIPNVIASQDLSEVETRIRTTEISGMLPFTLVVFDANARSIRQLSWDRKAISVESICWRPRHWFSSSLSDRDAAAVRGQICAIFHEHRAKNVESVRELHRSHSPVVGPFSICVHRQDVGTVSYSEIEIARDGITFSYADGAPCKGGLFQTVRLSLVNRRSPSRAGNRNQISGEKRR